MKTAEEILLKKGIVAKNTQLYLYPDVSVKNIIEAMEEYASQQKIDLREECQICGNKSIKELHCTECGNNFKLRI